jgi:hypothetical protein
MHLRAANTQLKQDNKEVTKQAEQLTVSLTATQKKVQEIPNMRKLIADISAVIFADDEG